MSTASVSASLPESSVYFIPRTLSLRNVHRSHAKLVRSQTVRDGWCRRRRLVVRRLLVVVGLQQAREGRQPRIDRVVAAVARSFIPIGAALRAQALAIEAAQRVHGNGQQEVFADEGREIQMNVVRD